MGPERKPFCRRGHDLSVTRYFTKSGRTKGRSMGCYQCSMNWHANNKPRDLATRKANYKANPKSYWVRNLKNKYGVTVAEYDQMLAEQGGLCAVCRGPETREGFQLGVDHDHTTGAVRGLLCTKCNAAVGFLDDSRERARALADYLESRAQAKIQFDKLRLVRTE